ncbi:MAG: M20/M25/M40 family metallo-hydrolase [Bacteroidales bacterium]|nr:M20/M25/M40 family metallo-hydrolase [Bacteroidales bacterium]
MKDQWRYDGQASSRLSELMGIISPSMDEVAMATFLRKNWEVAGAIVRTDVMGNVYATLGKGNELNLGIIAHMDTVAVQVTNILPSGLLQMRSIGLRPHTLLGQSMKVKTRNGIIDGVIGFDPTSQYGQPKGLVDEDLWMDIGASSYEQACKTVEIGDLSVFAPRVVKMGEDNICGTAIDDRIGLFIMNECLNWFATHGIKVNLHFIGSVQEEVGLRGAAILAANTHLDACVVLDVDYATDTPTPHENQMGPLRLGRGPGMHVKSDNNPVLRRICKEVADREGIPYQLSLGRFIYGGTDGTSLQIQQKGISVVNINIPCRYMHSPVEMCSIKDVENAVQLLIAVIVELAKRKTYCFIPGLD